MAEIHTETTPTFVLDQNLKHFEGVAAANRADAERALIRAAEAESKAEVFRDALAKLKAA